MNRTTPPISRQQTPDAIAEQLVADATQAITQWVARTRERGLRIPFVSSLFARMTNAE